MKPGRSASRWPLDRVALFLDLDGTLIPIVETPDAARADQYCRRTLARAHDRLEGRIAILSGRTIEAVDTILEGAVPCVAGVHGLRRRNGRNEVSGSPADPRVEQAAAALRALAEKAPGLIVEAKGPSVAIHYRRAPGAEAAVLDVVGRLAKGSGLEVQLGKAVAELRTPGPNKATALRQFMSEVPFLNARPLFLGDDLTDEPALAEAQRLGGAGILVGEDRTTHAVGRLADPATVIGWIAASLEAGQFDMEAVGWVG